MIVKFSNGEAHVKDFCPRKIRKEINKALFYNVETITEKAADGGKDNIKAKGFSPECMDRANDAALVGMVEKLIIDGQETPVGIDAFDVMKDTDVDIIIDAINQITSKELPNG